MLGSDAALSFHQNKGGLHVTMPNKSPSEAAIALAIVLMVYRNVRSIMTDRLTSLKG